MLIYRAAQPGDLDDIMRLIHGIAQVLAYLWFGKRETELPTVMDQECIPEEVCSFRLL